MANYAVTNVVTDTLPLVKCAAAMETALEAIDNTKTLRLVQMYQLAGDTFVGVIIHDA